MEKKAKKEYLKSRNSNIFDAEVEIDEVSPIKADEKILEPDYSVGWWDKIKKQIFSKNLSKGKSLFIADEPSDNDEFDFSHYVNSLEAIIRQCATPFVVGIFGKWGVGKTTLINKFLRKRLETQNNIGFVYFDAWKYQKNAFYRQFLKKIQEDLSINSDTLLVRFYKTIKITRELSEWEWNKQEILNLIFESFAWYILWLIFLFEINWSLPTLYRLFLSTFPSMIRVWANRGAKLVRIKKQDEEDKPLFSNEQFEDVFKMCIKNELSTRPDGKIVIVIDNLDRCVNEVAIELLGTIKTFLNIKGCVYLIPVDEIALINHLKRGLLNTGSNDEQSREFLKKFFQTTIRLAPFIRGDLEKYIDHISNEVAIPYETDIEKRNIASLVLTAYLHTPRKIKQFYNNLTAKYLMALSQEKQGNIDKGFITKNISFLAKVIILQEEWPGFFEYIKKDHDILNSTEDFLMRDKNFTSPHFEAIKKYLAQYPILKIFLQSSSPYNSPDIGPFINFKQEKYESLDGKTSEWEISILAGNSDGALAVFKGTDDAAKNSILKLIENKLGEKEQQEKAAAVFNILLIISRIFPFVSKNQKEKIANLFVLYLSRNTQLANTQEFSVNNLFEILPEINSRYKNSREIILNEHIKKIGQNPEEIFEYFNSGYGKHVNIVPETTKEKLAEALETIYKVKNEETENNVSYVANVLDSCIQLSEHKGALAAYLTEGLIDALLEEIKKIKPETLDELQEKNFNVIKKAVFVLKEDKLKILLENINYILESVTGWGEAKEKLAEFSNEIVMSNILTPDLTKEIAKHYSGYLNSSNVDSKYRINLLPAVKKLMGTSNEAKKIFIGTFQNIISNQDIAQLKEILAEAEKQKIVIRDEMALALAERISKTTDKDQREALFIILETFGVSKSDQLYISAIKNIVLASENFEITNHAISKLDNNRSLIQGKNSNEIVQKLLEWSVSLIGQPKRTTPFGFLAPSFDLLSEINKEKLIDTWSEILEKDSEPIGVKTEICEFIKNKEVINNFPKSRKEDFLRKLINISKTTGLDEKKLFLETLISLKPLYSLKTTFIKEIKEYGRELQQQPEESQEHKIGSSLLKGLGLKKLIIKKRVN